MKSYSQKAETTRTPVRVLVGLSGGTYSAVTAALLKAQGHEVVGLYLDVGQSCPSSLNSIPNRCCVQGSRQEAQAIASRLGIDFHVIDISELYQGLILDPLARECSQGRVPNPCVSCYHEVKLKTLLKQAPLLRCDKVATGHGAQLYHDPRTDTMHLVSAADAGRDQSYFLFTLKQEELSRLLMPLGNFPRTMVNRLAAENGFKTQETRSGTEICFVGKPENWKALIPFVESRVAPALRYKGVIKSTDNQVLGEHEGIHLYRVGTKPDVLLSTKEADSWVVLDVDAGNFTLKVGPEELLKRSECLLVQTSWIGPMNHLKGIRCQARVSPEGEYFSCRLTHFENDTARVEFDEPQGPIIPGQAVVLYHDREVLGGGWIDR